ncbi:hypothetical protein [uncultured Roseovarius sp.]|uniref:hypothetical protein n=1 Tax=uncultured Roseovarius sp. TaxID=293344 RepID=UPI002605164F|nr:hypothetical protein [uncultured Roseovarius sp.]
MIRIAIAALIIFLPPALSAQEGDPVSEPPMTLETLGQIISTLDPEAQTNGAAWQFEVAGTMVFVVTDAKADRMRAMVPIRKSDEISTEDLTRMMQANFDSALDARYAIAQGTLWATFIHPLSPLEKKEFISSLGQTVNLAQSYGTLYSGGALQFEGGDSAPIQRRLIDELLKKGEEI